MTRRLKCRIDPEQSPYTCMLPEHKPVRRGREMIDLLAVEEPKPKPAGGGKIRDCLKTHLEDLFEGCQTVVLKAVNAKACAADVGPDAEILDRSVEYDRAWDEHFHDRPCVSLCLFIVGDVDRDRRAAELALTHDSVLSA